MRSFFRTSRLQYILCVGLYLILSTNAIAQSKAERYAAQRYEIDAKRSVANINSEDALPRSREFKRIDSTYYVGWMFEGVYKFDHAADYIGFKRAAEPLERALRLMERDYKKQLKTRTSDLMTYYPVYNYHLDYTLIAYYLVNCYNSMEEPEKTYQLLRRALSYRFQRDYYLDAYNYMAWIVHRHRFYTSDKYSFLKNSIEENEELANTYLDSALRNVRINKSLNREIFQPGYERGEKVSVYHYKSILHSYQLNIDSAAYYYGLMKKNYALPHNNYATFRSICGDFREAEAEYNKARSQESGDKRLKEWAYYSANLNVYKALPEKAIEITKQMIQANGSTPGFGWYNIALARAMHYDGQIKETERYAKKASEFKELHLNTTLGQSHYDFSVSVLNITNIEARIERLKFENSNWWYNPKVLAKIGKLYTEKYAQQFLIINQLSENPERDQVIYKLFSTESTVTWDEVWYLVRDYSTKFFLNKFEHEMKNDDRKHIRKYFKFFVARLKMEQDDYKEARLMLNEVLQDPNIDKEYEQLFLARVYQAQAECAKEREDMTAYKEWMDRMYNIYPQLIPTTGLSMDMGFHISGTVDNEVMERLKDCNINENTNRSKAPQAYISFGKSGDKKRITYYVLESNGNYAVKKQSFSYENSEKAGLQLAYKLFDIGSQIDNQDEE